MADSAADLWLGERSEYNTTDFDGRLRRCHILGRLTSEAPETGTLVRPPSTTLLWVRLDPPLVLHGGRYEEVILQARHVGNDVDRLGDTSISVYVCEIRSREGFEHGRISPGSIHLLAWADVARDPAFLPPTQEEGFDRTFEMVRRYAEREGDSNVPPEHREDGVPLGNWVLSIKRSQASGELRADWADRLTALPGWRWGVDADRDWDFAASYGRMWLSAPDGAETIGLDRRLRICDPVGNRSPIEDAHGRSAMWVYVYPPLRLEGDSPGMLVITAGNAVENLRELGRSAVNVEVAHVDSWRQLPDGTRRPDQVSALGSAVVARDPALLPAMSEEEWDAGLRALRTYRDEIGHCWVPIDYVPKGDHSSVVHLGGWALRVRGAYRRGDLSAGRAALLASVPDWHWSRADE